MKIIENASLAKLNTFGVDAKARHLVIIDNEKELASFFAERAQSGNKLLILGGGSNILLLSSEIPLVLQYSKKGISTISVDSDTTTLEVSAGEIWDDVVAYAVSNNLGGIENLSLIPGTAGAAPIQNIGAYGQELCDVVSYIKYFSFTSKRIEIRQKAECGFGYRDSIFKKSLKNQVIITAIGLRLQNDPKPNLSYAPLHDRFKDRRTSPEISEIRDVIIDIRKTKLADPEEIGNGGSFFKNPVISPNKFEALKKEFPHVPSFPQENGIKVPAGWLIETAGWKGKRIGNVGSYRTQALVLVNYGGATGKEIIDFAEMIKTDVSAKFGIELEFEINVVEVG